MTESPILMSGAMVRATLGDLKTQTRRVVKPQPPANVTAFSVSEGGYQYLSGIWGQTDAAFVGEPIGCPYGNRGDRLWVRETWQSAAEMNVVAKADDYFLYKATDPDWSTFECWKWRPSIFMPRAACRLPLEITDIRLQRLQDISEEDAIAEGIDIFADGAGFTLPGPDGKTGPWHRNPEDAYQQLWDQLNAERGYGWEVNPWVWAITFKRITP